ISPFGTMLMGIDPTATFAVCMLPRIAMGILVAFIYHALARPSVDSAPKRSRSLSAMGIAFLSSALLNTALFVALFLLLFGSTEFVRGLQGSSSILVFAATFVGINGVAEAIIATIAGTAIGTALERAGILTSS
ncbi:MAG: hypothetical protein FWD41_03410, partial [Actinomycetia bacterium]|nr:hypothetical protein [Actinomycetes bacterium]